jgi:hypothetical protein
MPIDPIVWKAFDDRVNKKTSYSQSTIRKLKGNSRAVQPLNDRKFYFNDSSNKVRGSDATKVVTTAALGIAAILAL